MKTLIAFLSLFVVPLNLLADACTDPDNYQIDKRCYVTKEQQETSPYNAVVELVGPLGTYCSGVVIKQNDELYLYTAQHCLKNEDTGKIQKHVTFKTKGKYFGADQYVIGKVNDWAIYKVTNKKNSPDFTELSDKFDGPGSKQVKLIGYGTLKIMSDEEIVQFKKNYKKYLETFVCSNCEENKRIYGITEFQDVRDIEANKESVFYDNEYVQQYLDDNFETFKAFFMDFNLKESDCYYSNENGFFACQSWKGNSGGGIFDTTGNLMGISIGSTHDIGGPNHAKTGRVVNIKYGLK